MSQAFPFQRREKGLIAQALLDNVLFRISNRDED